MLTDPGQALEIATAIQAKAQKEPPGNQKYTDIATAHWLQGEAYLRLHEMPRAVPLIKNAISLVSKIAPNSALYGNLLLSRGGIETAEADVAAALSDYQQAFKIFSLVGDTRSQAISLVSIAWLYQEARDYHTALKYYAQALDVYHGDPKLLLSIYNNRGSTNMELHRFDVAEAQFRQALVIARGMESPVLESQIMRNIARDQLAAGHLDQADRTIASGLRTASQTGSNDSQPQFLSVAAQAALQRGRLAQAERLITQSFAGVDLTQTPVTYRQSHLTAFEIFKRRGQDGKALAHLEALKRLDDQTSELAASTNTALMAARFDYTNQNLKIAKLKADELQRSIDYEQAQARLQRMIFIGLAVATVIVVSLLAFGLITIRRSRNEVRAANIDLAATNSALAKALAAKTEFLATTSHEIRTPLNGILGMTQVMLADRNLAEATRERIGIVHGAGVTMRALVDDILDVAKMETGNMTIERAPLNLCATMTDVSRMWEEQARARGIDFILELDSCPATIEGDAARLRQIVFNLLSNAIKFTESGSVTLTAGTSADDRRLTISVADTGIGVPEDKQAEIFESFKQGDAGTTRKFGGTGLGLAICRNLARAMDGDVSVRSEAGGGSVFTLDLPLIAATQGDGEIIQCGDAHALLIVDRNPITRSMLRALLAVGARTVFFAGSAEEAADAIGEQAVADVLIDDATIRMADDPYDALTRIAEAACAAGARTILLWPAPADEERARLLETGIDRVIGKPVAGAALKKILYPDALDDVGGDAHIVSHAA